MRIIAPILIAMLAIMGIAAAAVDQVEIISPQDGDRFTLGDTVRSDRKVSARWAMDGLSHVHKW